MRYLVPRQLTTLACALCIGVRLLGVEVGDTREKVVHEKGAPIGEIQAGVNSCCSFYLFSS
jgi:hypothetical protein